MANFGKVGTPQQGGLQKLGMQGDAPVEYGPFGGARHIVGQTPDGRPIVRNDDGSFSTERSATTIHPELNEGMPTNIPTMYGGQEHTEDAAIRRILEAGGSDPETGRNLPGFESIDQAVDAAQRRSELLGALMRRQTGRGN